MSSRASTIVFALLAVVIAAVWFFAPPKALKTAPKSSSSPTYAATTPAATSTDAAKAGTATTATTTTSQSPVADSDRSHLADDLNSPTGTIGNDVRILSEIFTHWTTNFPRTGNPVGTNAEITAALTGKNKLALALIPPDHAAINRDGELVDRWGTPFRFHQWSGSVTEVISAGPDKKFATSDDVSSIQP